MPEEMRGPSFVTLIFPYTFRSISVARLHMFWISVLTSELTYLGIVAPCQKVVHTEEFDHRSFVFAPLTRIYTKTSFPMLFEAKISFCENEEQSSALADMWLVRLKGSERGM